MRRVAGAVAGVASLVVAMRADAAACQGRPTDPAGYQGYSYGADVVKSYASARIRVHYATSGKNAPDLATTRGDAVPDTVALAAEVGEKALAKYAEMGFKQGPDDAACTSNGGDGKLDIYLVAFAGADGTTVPEACSGNVCASFVLVESTFAGRGYANAAEGFRTVVAHELFHTVQNGYDAQLDRFWAEGTAQWAMKNVYPELADFERQMPPFFKDNTRSLDTQPSGVTAGFLYGSAVWPLFLTLRHGPDTVRDILEKEGDGTKAVAATDAILMGKGSSIAEDYPLFGAWNAATKTLAGTGGYPDAAKYPGVKIEKLADGAAGITSGLSYFAYRTTLDAPSKISVETDATRNAGIAVPIAGGKPDLGRAAKLPANMEGDVLVVVAGITSKKTDAPFTVHIGAADPAIAPDAGAPTSSSGGGGGGGGCTTTRSREGAHARDAFAALAAMLAGLVVARRRRR
jgi:hypothetical protein